MNSSHEEARLARLAEQDAASAEDLAWLQDTLAHEDVAVRAEAALLLGEFLAPAQAFPVLAPLVADAAPRFKAALFEALGPVLLEASEHDLLDLTGRPAWVEERGWVAPADAATVLAVLSKAAQSPTAPPAVRVAALRSLGYVGHLPEVDALIALYLEAAEPEAREAALEAAAASGRSDRWLVPVISALGDSVATVRSAAALAAGQLQLQDALPYIEAMTMEGDPDEQLAAAISSLLLTDPEERAPLLEQLALRGVPDELIAEAIAEVADLEDAGEEEEEEEEEYDDDDAFAADADERD